MSEEQIDWKKKYKELRRWCFNTMLISILFNTIKGKTDKEFSWFDGAFFEARCGTHSVDCYEKLKIYIMANADKDILERANKRIDW